MNWSTWHVRRPCQRPLRDWWWHWTATASSPTQSLPTTISQGCHGRLHLRHSSSCWYNSLQKAPFESRVAQNSLIDTYRLVWSYFTVTFTHFLLFAEPNRKSKQPKRTTVRPVHLGTLSARWSVSFAVWDLHSTSAVRQCKVLMMMKWDWMCALLVPFTCRCAQMHSAVVVAVVQFVCAASFVLHKQFDVFADDVVFKSFKIEALTNFFFLRWLLFLPIDPLHSPTATSTTDPLLFYQHSLPSLWIITDHCRANIIICTVDTEYTMNLQLYSAAESCFALILQTWFIYWYIDKLYSAIYTVADWFSIVDLASI